MNKRIILIGAGGHGKVVYDIVCAQGDTVVGFLDDHATGTCCGVPILGCVRDAVNYTREEFVIAVGANHVRRRIAEVISVPWYTAIHPSAVVSPSAVISAGTVVMPNAVIQAEAVVGKHCIINTGAVVEHENRIGDYAHVSPSATLGGNVHIGEESHIGISACVKNNISVCAGCTVGAGAVVVKNLVESGIYVGVPARRMK